MDARRVAMFCEQGLLSESVQSLLSCVDGLALLGPWALDDDAMSYIAATAPDVILIVDQRPGTHQAAALTSQCLEHCPSLPVIQVALETAQVRVFSSHTLPARSQDLIEALKQLP